MIYVLNPNDALELLSKPETGMGYQIVKANPLGEEGKKLFLVYNSDLAVEMNEEFKEHHELLKSNGYVLTKNRANRDLLLDKGSIKILSHQEFCIAEVTFSRSFINQYHRQNIKRGATENPPVNPDGVELFLRVCAHPYDCRIDYETQRLLPGSFAISFNDYLTCFNTQDDPTDRYSMPNHRKIKWAFVIQPKTTDLVCQGGVQPIFDEMGGGVEIYFENGTSENTFIERVAYGLPHNCTL